MFLGELHRFSASQPTAKVVKSTDWLSQWLTLKLLGITNIQWDFFLTLNSVNYIVILSESVPEMGVYSTSNGGVFKIVSNSLMLKTYLALNSQQVFGCS